MSAAFDRWERREISQITFYAAEIKTRCLTNCREWRDRERKGVEKFIIVVRTGGKNRANLCAKNFCVLGSRTLCVYVFLCCGNAVIVHSPNSFSLQQQIVGKKSPRFSNF